jgi:pimeloyl-ACP methyl ester carboxylesterase
VEVSVLRRKVFLADQGKGVDPARPTILFIHGAGMDHSVWPLQARHFAYRGWNALAIDLPGHGRSPAGKNGKGLLANVPAMAHWIGRLLKALEIERSYLVGHSMGALIALEVAARHGGRVAGIALLGAAATMPVHPALLDAAGRPEALAPAMICDWGFGPAGHFGGHRAPGSWMLGHGMTLLARSAGAVLYTDLAACAGYDGGVDAAAAVSCPALVVAGRLDRMTPAKAGLKLAGLIPGARAVVIEDAGHMVMVERPDATLDALTGFLIPLP